MADLSLDELLSSSLKSAAEPANSAGVADAIRARVAAGDAGASVVGTTAPGWTPPKPTWFGPLIGAVSGLGAVLLALVAVLVLPLPLLTPAPVVTPTPIPTVTASPTPNVTPTPTPTPSEEEQPPPPPPPPRDTTSPKISAGQWSSGEVYASGSTCTPLTADIVVTATDETQLADVSASTNLPGTTATFVGSSGSEYTFRFSGSTESQVDQQVNVTFLATDDAGNTAVASRSIVLHPVCFIIG